MRPTLNAGDFVIASRFFMTLHKGDLVIIRHPTYNKIIKRIKSICPERGLLLIGENQDSLSSEQMGWVDPKTTMGKVRFIIRQQNNNNKTL